MALPLKPPNLLGISPTQQREEGERARRRLRPKRIAKCWA